MKKNKKENNSEEEKKINSDIKDLVKMRLNAIPKGFSISVGSQGNFTVEDLIKHIEDDDEIGKSMVEIDMEFLRDLKNGKLYEQIAFDN
jgi:hypothetical protein